MSDFDNYLDEDHINELIDKLEVAAENEPAVNLFAGSVAEFLGYDHAETVWSKLIGEYLPEAIDCACDDSNIVDTDADTNNGGLMQEGNPEICLTKSQLLELFEEAYANMEIWLSDVARGKVLSDVLEGDIKIAQAILDCEEFGKNHIMGILRKYIEEKFEEIYYRQLIGTPFGEIGGSEDEQNPEAKPVQKKDYDELIASIRQAQNDDERFLPGFKPLRKEVFDDFLAKIAQLFYQNEITQDEFDNICDIVVTDFIESGGGDPEIYGDSQEVTKALLLLEMNQDCKKEFCDALYDDISCIFQRFYVPEIQNEEYSPDDYIEKFSGQNISGVEKIIFMQEFQSSWPEEKGNVFLDNFKQYLYSSKEVYTFKELLKEAKKIYERSNPKCDMPPGAVRAVVRGFCAAKSEEKQYLPRHGKFNSVKYFAAKLREAAPMALEGTKFSDFMSEKIDDLDSYSAEELGELDKAFSEVVDDASRYIADRLQGFKKNLTRAKLVSFAGEFFSKTDRITDLENNFDVKGIHFIRFCQNFILDVFEETLRNPFPESAGIKLSDLLKTTQQESSRVGGGIRG